MNMDTLFDLLVLVGLIGLAVAVWAAWGWVAVLAFGSTVALVVGVVGAYVWKMRRGIGQAGGDAFGDVIEGVVFKERAEVVIHALALLEGTGEDADLAAGLEEEIEERGDGAEESFAAATVGPDGAVGGALRRG